MKSKTRHLLSVLIGVLILIAGVRGLMGISSKNFIPHELYIVFGLFSIGLGLWKFLTAEEDAGGDSK